MNKSIERFNVEERTNFEMIKTYLPEDKLAQLQEAEIRIYMSGIDGGIITSDAIAELEALEKKYDVHWIDKKGKGWND